MRTILQMALILILALVLPLLAYAQRDKMRFGEALGARVIRGSGPLVKIPAGTGKTTFAPPLKSDSLQMKETLDGKKAARPGPPVGGR